MGVSMKTIRPATETDLHSITEIYSYARKQMQLSGNPTQWGNDKPTLETIQADIRKKQAYVILSQGHICGVFAFILGPEPTYHFIEDGAWLNDAPYGTIHRIAGNGQVTGLLAAALSFCEDKTANIRIDTHENNKIMQHLLEKYGFTKCGRIYVEDGTPRIAYQRYTLQR